MEIDSTNMGIEQVTKSELLGLDSWNRPRSSEQLLEFLARREAMIAESDDEEIDE